MSTHHKFKRAKHGNSQSRLSASELEKFAGDSDEEDVASKVSVLSVFYLLRRLL